MSYGYIQIDLIDIYKKKPLLFGKRRHRVILSSARQRERERERERERVIQKKEGLTRVVYIHISLIRRIEKKKSVDRRKRKKNAECFKTRKNIIGFHWMKV